MKTVFYRFILFVLLMSIVQHNPAQNNTEKGDRYFDQNMFDMAIKYYQLDIKIRNKKQAEKAMQKLADCYRIIGEFEKAEEVYKKILKKNKKDPKNYLNYGLSLKNSAKFAEAKVQLEEYVKLKPDDPYGKLFIASCDSAQNWLDQTLGLEVKNLNHLNSELSDFSPVMTPDGKLLYSSSRPGSTHAFISLDGGNQQNRLDLYEIDLSHLEKEITKNKELNGIKTINTPEHEGTATLSSDGNEMYFTKTVKGKKDTYTNNVLMTLQVFYSKKDSAGNWSKPISAFSFNSINYSVAHPNLSYDGKMIVFMSDKPGGKGNTDIYYSLKNDKGQWGPPVNAGAAINTFGYELFPYLAKNGDLYFSSNAHPGMGQLDIFCARKNNIGWDEPLNLKPPLNSIGNDFGIFLDGNSFRGLFSSDRFNGKGAEDIYTFSLDESQEIEVHQDTLKVRNLSLFDDVKFNFENLSDSSQIESIQSNGYFLLPVVPNKVFAIQSKRFGMPYNSIELHFEIDSLKHDRVYYFSTTKKPLLVTGKCFIGDKSKKPDNTPPDEPATLTDNGFALIEMNVNLNGVFLFKANIPPGQTAKLNSAQSTTLIKE